MADNKNNEELDNEELHLRYPLNSDGYKGKVTFTVMKISPITAKDIATEYKNTRDVSEQIIDESVKGDAPKSQTYNNLAKEKNPAGRVTLYLPASLNISDGVGYANTPLGTIGAAAAQGLESGGVSGAVKAVGKGIGSFATAFDNLNLDGPLGRLAVTRAAQTFAPAEVGAAVQLKTRVAINPNTRATFESVAVREIPFSFKMVAQSAKEAEAITQIIKFFRTQLYPSSLAAGQADFILGYNLPDPFEIKITYDGKQVATRFVDAYLKNVQTVYNSQSMGMHKDGHFTDVEISLSFVETRTLTRDDVEQGY
jgi:hypothetical protein